MERLGCIRRRLQLWQWPGARETDKGVGGRRQNRVYTVPGRVHTFAWYELGVHHVCFERYVELSVYSLLA